MLKDFRNYETYRVLDNKEKFPKPIIFKKLSGDGMLKSSTLDRVFPQKQSSHNYIQWS